MTVHRGPFNSVYAGHIALHAIGTGLILTLSHSLPVSIFLLSGSLPVYSGTIRLIFSHYQAYCMSTLTRRLAIYLFSHSHLGSLRVYSLALIQARCLSILSRSLRLAACLFSRAHSDSLPDYSLALTQARCLSILSLSG